MNNYNFYETNIDWIGAIPDSWNFIRGRYLFKSKKEINKNLQCKNLLSLTLSGVLNKDYQSSEGLRPENYNTYQIFERNDLVFKMIDLENIKTSRVGIVHEKGIMSPVYIRHEPFTNLINPKFAYWFYFDLYKKNIYNNIGKGVRSSLTSSDLLDIKLPLPHLNEQKLISKFLNKKTQTIDTLIKKIEKKINLLKEQKTALINLYVTKGLEPIIEKKDSGVEWIGEIPKHWELKKLKYFTKIIYGISPSEKTYNYEGIGTILINGPVEYSKEDFGETRAVKWTTEPTKIVPKGYLLFCLRGSTTGRMNISHDEVSIGRGVCAIKSKFDQDFLVFAMMMIRIYIQDQLSGSTFPSVTKDDVDNFKIPLPSFEEQKNISSFLKIKINNFNQYIELYKKKIELLKEYRLSLISSVVTGKIRITEDMI
tara:strand:- start:140 stop:1411 length:1272 start_codon:yes stop_codon:yes gene_type:complete